MDKSDLPQYLSEHNAKIHEYYADDDRNWNWFPIYWADDETLALEVLLALHEHLKELGGVDDKEQIASMRSAMDELAEKVKNKELSEEELAAAEKQLPFMQEIIDERLKELEELMANDVLNPDEFVITQVHARLGSKDGETWLWVCKETHPKAELHWQLVRKGHEIDKTKKNRKTNS